MSITPAIFQDFLIYYINFYSIVVFQIPSYTLFAEKSNTGEFIQLMH